MGFLLFLILILLNGFSEFSATVLFLFIPAGVFFGVPFGIALHRWLIVAHSEYGAKVVPVTWLSRNGRLLKGWFAAGIVILIVLVLVVIPSTIHV